MLIDISNSVDFKKLKIKRCNHCLDLPIIYSLIDTKNKFIPTYYFSCPNDRGFHVSSSTIQWASRNWNAYTEKLQLIKPIPCPYCCGPVQYKAEENQIGCFNRCVKNPHIRVSCNYFYSVNDWNSQFSGERNDLFINQVIQANEKFKKSDLYEIYKKEAKGVFRG